jgi:hypothetical protein
MVRGTPVLGASAGAVPLRLLTNCSMCGGDLPLLVVRFAVLSREALVLLVLPRWTVDACAIIFGRALDDDDNDLPLTTLTPPSTLLVTLLLFDDGVDRRAFFVES